MPSTQLAGLTVGLERRVLSRLCLSVLECKPYGRRNRSNGNPVEQKKQSKRERSKGG